MSVSATVCSLYVMQLAEFLSLPCVFEWNSRGGSITPGHSLSDYDTGDTR